MKIRRKKKRDFENVLSYCVLRNVQWLMWVRRKDWFDGSVIG